MKLIYNSQTFDYTPATDRPQTQAHAINWRYQVPGRVEHQSPIEWIDCPARAINWRFQVR